MNDDKLSEDSAGQLAEGLRPLPLDEAAKIRMKAQIFEQINVRPVDADAPQAAAPTVADASQTSTGIAVASRYVRVSDRQWVKRMAGVDICVLSETPERRTYLLRMAAGSFLPGHSHRLDEESVLLEGDACVGGDLHLKAGDYHCVKAGVPHPIITSEHGCIVFVTGEHRPRVQVDAGLVSRWVSGLSAKLWPRSTN